MVYLMRTCILTGMFTYSDGCHISPLGISRSMT